MDADCGWMVDACVKNACDDPVRLFRILIRDPSVPLNGPQHHIIVPICLITATWSITGDFDLESYLNEAISRASDVPQAVCGLWGCCGSAIGAGIYLSIMTRTGPVSKGKRWGQCNGCTSSALSRISEIGGPRCCKRNAVLSILSACATAEDVLGVRMSPSAFGCTGYDDCRECIGSRCPFFPQKRFIDDREEIT